MNAEVKCHFWLLQVPYLPRFRQTFPNVENFEFLETDIHSLDQLNALSLVQVSSRQPPKSDPVIELDVNA